MCDNNTERGNTFYPLKVARSENAFSDMFDPDVHHVY
jgi:hypothetical protein